jgi:phosphoglycolate phosphatase
MPRLIIFDLDGTLIDSAKCIVISTREAFTLGGLVPPSEGQIIGAMGIPIERTFTQWSGLEDPTPLIESYRNLYRQKGSELIRAYDGIAQLLQTLSETDVVMTIATSKKREVAEQNLTDCGLRNFFCRVVGSNDVSHYKPHPESVQLLLQSTEFQTHETWVVGDSTFDLEMGKAAGCKVCAVTWGAHSKDALSQCQPEALVDSVEELLRVLQ